MLLRTIAICFSVHTGHSWAILRTLAFRWERLEASILLLLGPLGFPQSTSEPSGVEVGAAAPFEARSHVVCSVSARGPAGRSTLLRFPIGMAALLQPTVVSASSLHQLCIVAFS